MATFKGTIKFISDTKQMALVEESILVGTEVTSTGLLIGIGDGSERSFSGQITSTGPVEAGSISILVNDVEINAADYKTSTGEYGYIQGSAITTSTGFENIINYRTGVIEFTTTVGSTPGNNQSVKVAFTEQSVGEFTDGIKIVRGDFTNYEIDDIIYYSYNADSDLEDGHGIHNDF